MKDRYFEIITLEVGKKQDKFIPEMMVRLYLWLDWPDKYVPNTGLGLMKLIRKIGLGTKQNSGPIVIHCSAGVGRTGTVAAAAVCSGRIEAKKTISVREYYKIDLHLYPCTDCVCIDNLISDLQHCQGSPQQTLQLCPDRDPIHLSPQMYVRLHPQKARQDQIRRSRQLLHRIRSLHQKPGHSRLNSRFLCLL